MLDPYLVHVRRTGARRLEEIATNAEMIGKANQVPEKYRVDGVTSDSVMRLQKTGGFDRQILSILLASGPRVSDSPPHAERRYCAFASRRSRHFGNAPENLREIFSLRLTHVVKKMQ